MPLAKQTVFVPLGKAYRHDIADLILPIDVGVLALFNAYQNRTGQIVKRRGASTLTNTTTAGGSISTPWQLSTYQGALVALGYAGGPPIATYSEAASKWEVPASDLRGPVAVSHTQVNDFIGAGGATVSAVDLAYSSGYYLASYVGGTFAFYDLIDATTGAKVVSLEISNGKVPHCAFVSGKAVAIYTTGTTLVTKVIDLSTFAVTTTTVNALPNATTTLDVRATSGGGFAACYRDGANVLRETLFTSGLVSTDYTVKDQGGTNVTANVGTGGTFTYVSPLSDAGTQRSIVCFDSVNGARAHFNLTTSGSNQQAASTITLDASATAGLTGACAAWTITSTPTDIQATWTTTAPLTKVAQRLSGVTTTLLAQYLNVNLASKAWKVGTDFFFAVVDAGGTVSVVRSTYTTNPAPIAHAFRGAAQAGSVPNVPTISGNPRVLISSLISIDAVGGTFHSTSGIDILNLNYPAVADRTIGPPVEAQGSLYVPTGGQLAQWDGRNYAEVGFPYVPTIIASSLVAGGSLTASADYTYQIVYCYFDNNGQVSRSAPSVPLTITTTPGNQSVQLTIQTLTLTGRDVELSFIEIYRGAANNSEELTLVARIQNDPTGPIVYLDTAADTTIAGALPLYTTGGILESATPLPPTSLAIFALNRMWIVDGDDPTKLWPSNSVVDGQGLRFATDNILELREVSATPITALAALDDKVIVFKSDRIYAITGDGPNAAGVGAFNVQTIAIGIGTVAPHSVATFVHGIIFKGASGIQFLDRGLSIGSPIPGTQMIGQPLRDLYNALVIVDAINVPEQNQVRLYNTTGATLVLDYVSWAWSIYTGQPANTGTIWKGAGAYWNGQVFAESAISFAEGPNLYSMQVNTPWVQLAQVGGFERVYRIQGVGLTLGDHTVNVGYSINGDTDTDLGTKSRVMSTTEVVWPWEFRPKIQKCASMMFAILETNASATAGPAITGIALVVGVKQGLRKLHAPTARVT